MTLLIFFALSGFSSVINLVAKKCYNQGKNISHESNMYKEDKITLSLTWRQFRKIMTCQSSRCAFAEGRFIDLIYLEPRYELSVEQANCSRITTIRGKNVILNLIVRNYLPS